MRLAVGHDRLGVGSIELCGEGVEPREALADIGRVLGQCVACLFGKHASVPRMVQITQCLEQHVALEQFVPSAIDVRADTRGCAVDLRELAQQVCAAAELQLDELTERLFSRVGTLRKA